MPIGWKWNVPTSKKVTHAGRGSGTRHAQEMGAGIEEIAQHGNWNNSRVVLRCLSGIPKDVPHKLAGFGGQGERSWLARNTLVPSLELQRKLWPFIEDRFPGGENGQRWLGNIMKDRPTYHGRPTPSRYKYSSADFNKMQLMMLLAHLRKVVLQDAAVLMRKNDDASYLYSRHHIFEDSVLKDPLFVQFANDLHRSMETTSPLSTDSLRANAPAIHHEFRSISDRIHGLSLHMHAEFDGFTKNMTRLYDAHCDQLRQERDDRNARELNFIGTIRGATGDVLQRFSHLHTVYSSQHERQLDLNHHRSQQDQLHTSLPQFFRLPRQPQHQLPQPYQEPHNCYNGRIKSSNRRRLRNCYNSRPNSHRNSLKWKTNPDSISNCNKTNPKNCHPLHNDGYPSPSRHDCVSSDQLSEFRVCHDP
ncbi:hypothetical protein B0O80DRAFT_483904 [Mortierella sp. GBAus27b]|nr:hypothetical protein B0O80DRAFT_483904 [Mortierella sp. GBAus27b]